jgi:hypothetical protein
MAEICSTGEGSAMCAGLMALLERECETHALGVLQGQASIRSEQLAGLDTGEGDTGGWDADAAVAASLSLIRAMVCSSEQCGSPIIIMPLLSGVA